MHGGHREIELKRLLCGEAAAEKLLAALGPSAVEEKRQVNHVFDTVDHALDRQQYAVRLRIENGSAFLTVKGPSRAVGKSTGSKTEAEAEVMRETADEILKGHDDPVVVLMSHLPGREYRELWHGLERARAGAPLRRIGQFENVRRTIPVVLPSGLALHVEIDCTTFPGGRVDHEVEIEIPTAAVADEVEAWLETTAHAAGVTTTPSTPKVVRFLATQTAPEK